MGFNERQKIISQIEKLRGSKVITYIISTKPNIKTQIESRDLREIIKRIDEDGFDNCEKIDLFLYSNGGQTQVSWALVNLLREISSNFNVLIPYNAFSCATSITLGANEIVMCKTGILGPVDPQVSNDFNPEKGGVQIPISVEDIAGFISLLKDKFELRNENLLAKLSEILSTDIRPLALGNAYRHYLKARDDSRKLLELHMDAQNEKEKINKIVEILVEKLYYHGHHINRNEAKKIGLNIIFPDKQLSSLMWDLFLDYEDELQMTNPYVDRVPPSSKLELPIKCIETSINSSTYIIDQTWNDLSYPVGAKLTYANNSLAAFISPNTILPIVPRGQVLQIDGKIYEKIETTYWK